MAINEWYLKQEATTGLDPNVTYWRNKAGITPIEITGLAGEKNGIRYFSVKDSITTIPEDNIINLHFDGGNNNDVNNEAKKITVPELIRLLIGTIINFNQGETCLHFYL